MVELIDAQKTSAGKIGFLAENAIEFDRMADRFVNLEAELATAQDYRAGFCGALWGGVKRDRFFRNLRRVLEELKGLDEFVAAEDVLSAEAVGIGTLLDGVILERGGYEPAAGNDATLVNLRTGARSEPGIDLAELHVGFRKRYAFDFVYGGVGGEKQVQLGFEGNLEGILEAIVTACAAHAATPSRVS